MLEAVSKIAKLPSTFLFPFVQWPSSREHIDYSTAHIRPEELGFSLSVGGDKLQVLFISPKGLCIQDVEFIKCIKHNKRNLPSVIETAFQKPGQSTAFARWNQAKPGTHLLCWFDSL